MRNAKQRIRSATNFFIFAVQMLTALTTKGKYERDWKKERGVLVSNGPSS